MSEPVLPPDAPSGLTGAPRWVLLGIGALLVAAALVVPAWSATAVAVAGAAWLVIVSLRLRRPPRVPRRDRFLLKWMIRAAAVAASVSMLPGLEAARPVMLGAAAAAAALGAGWLLAAGHDRPQLPPGKSLWSEPLDAVLKRAARTRFSTERWVEVPWAAARLPARGRILDVGFVNADPAWRAIVRGAGRTVVGLDLARGTALGVLGVVGDLRAIPLADASVDAVVAISTVEHIGADNTRYTENPDQQEEKGDLAAAAELRRVLRPGGVALVTVPYGAAEDHGWFRQYDAARLRRLIGAFGGEAQVEYFRYAGGWRRARSEELAGAHYGAGEAPAATGVACLELRKPA